MKMFTDPTLLQWLGCVFGLAGSLLLAFKGLRFSGYGFVLYLVSNAFWAAYGVVTSAPALVVMQAGFSIASSIGIWQWLWRPYVKARSLTVAKSSLRVPKLNLLVSRS